MIPNKFSAFVDDGDHEARSYYPLEGFYRVKPASGGHDLVVTNDHTPDLYQMSAETLADFFTSIQSRYRYYRNDPKVDYVMAIYNHGGPAGASIAHPHAQIFASAVVPNQITKEMHGAEAYNQLHGGCVFCEMIKHEQQENVRILAEDENFIMFTFFAARFPFEIWLLPKAHRAAFENATSGEIHSLAETLQKGFKMLDATLKDPDINFFIHSLPTTSDESDYYHWHLEIAPRLSLYAGYELGSGMIIDVVSPEKAAEFLRGEAE